MKAQKGVWAFGFWRRIYWDWDGHNAAETRTGGGLNAHQTERGSSWRAGMRQREDMVEGVCDMPCPACVAPRRQVERVGCA